MIDATTSTELVGFTDIFLVDRETQQVVKHVRKTNQITEVFARWLLLGNLGTHNASSATVTSSDSVLTVDRNAISSLLGSCSTPKYQSVLTDLGTGTFGIYMMNEDVNITPYTQIPPYIKWSMDDLAESNNAGLDQPVVYYGTSTSTGVDGPLMSLDYGSSKWSRVGTNPTFTTTYIKDDDQEVTIKSIVLGVGHTQLQSKSGFKAHIAVFQSPAVIGQNWDGTWTDKTDSTSDKMNTPAVISKFLINKYLRTHKVDGRYCDGMYAQSVANSTNGRICFYDLGSKMVVDATEKTNNVYNPRTGEYFTSDPSKFVKASSEILGGIAIGNGKAIKVTNGTASVDTVSGLCTHRYIRISTITKLTEDTSESPVYVDVDVLGGQSASIPEEIYKNCAPVMVAKRGTDAEDDVLEVFVTCGMEKTGDYYGFVVKKLTIPVGLWRKSTLSFSQFMAQYANGYSIETVAIVPFAIGRYCEATPEAVDGDHYVIGTYDEKYSTGSSDITGAYYLPITHMLKGVNMRTWEYTENDNVDVATVNSRPIYCCSDTEFQPGFIFMATSTANKMVRVGDCIFAMSPFAGSVSSGSSATSARIAMLVNEEGLNPVVVNYDRRWNLDHGLVMSGLTLSEPIQKQSTQVLVVRYTYAFEIRPAAPSTVSNFSATIPSGSDAGLATRLCLHWDSQSKVSRYLLRRSTSAYTADSLTVTGAYAKEISLPIKPPVVYGDEGGHTDDTDVIPNTTYYYRILPWNDGGYGLPWQWTTCKSNPLVEKVWPPEALENRTSLVDTVYANSVDFLWRWRQPSKGETVGDVLYVNDIRPWFEQYSIQYRLSTSQDDLESASDKVVDQYENDDVKSYDSGTGKFVIQDRKPGREYYFKVRACGNGVTTTYSPWSDMLTVVMPAERTLAKPYDVTAEVDVCESGTEEDPVTKTIEFTFSRDNRAEGYTLSYAQCPCGDGSHATFDESFTNTTEDIKKETFTFSHTRTKQGENNETITEKDGTTGVKCKIISLEHKDGYNFRLQSTGNWYAAGTENYSLNYAPSIIWEGVYLPAVTPVLRAATSKRIQITNIPKTNALWLVDVDRWDTENSAWEQVTPTPVQIEIDTTVPDNPTDADWYATVDIPLELTPNTGYRVRVIPTGTYDSTGHHLIPGTWEESVWSETCTTLVATKCSTPTFIASKTGFSGLLCSELTDTTNTNITKWEVLYTASDSFDESVPVSIECDASGECTLDYLRSVLVLEAGKTYQFKVRHAYYGVLNNVDYIEGDWTTVTTTTKLTFLQPPTLPTSENTTVDWKSVKFDELVPSEYGAENIIVTRDEAVELQTLAEETTSCTFADLNFDTAYVFNFRCTSTNDNIIDSAYSNSLTVRTTPLLTTTPPTLDSLERTDNGFVLKYRIEDTQGEGKVYIRLEKWLYGTNYDAPIIISDETGTLNTALTDVAVTEEMDGDDKVYTITVTGKEPLTTYRCGIYIVRDLTIGHEKSATVLTRVTTNYTGFGENINATIPNVSVNIMRNSTKGDADYGDIEEQITVRLFIRVFATDENWLVYED